MGRALVAGEGRIGGIATRKLEQSLSFDHDATPRRPSSGGYLIPDKPEPRFLTVC
jgi:hypothetical protein